MNFDLWYAIRKSFNAVKASTMSKLELRPRFKRVSPQHHEEILSEIDNLLKDPLTKINGYVVDHHVVLKIPEQDQHYWSPQLSLEVEPLDEEEGSLIRGLFGPKPSVWLMFIFFYAVLGFISFVVMIIGFSQLNLGLSARILWLLPILCFLLIMVYFTARTGQKLGKEQMYELYHFLDDRVKMSKL